MPRLRHYVGPSWPPDIGAYDYVLALCPSDLAWEFLRRNPDYQRDYHLSRRGSRHMRRLKRRATAHARPALHPALHHLGPASLLWIRRCRHPKAADLLADQRRCPDPRSRMRARKGPLRSRPLPSLSAAPLTTSSSDRLEKNIVLLRDADRALTLRLLGSRACVAPVSPTFLVRGIPDPHRVAADFRTLAALVHSPQRTAPARVSVCSCAMPSSRSTRAASVPPTAQTAAVIYGVERARAAWSSSSTAIKERMRHALARGEQFRDGAYRTLLE